MNEYIFILIIILMIISATHIGIFLSLFLFERDKSFQKIVKSEHSFKYFLLGMLIQLIIVFFLNKYGIVSVP